MVNGDGSQNDKDHTSTGQGHPLDQNSCTSDVNSLGNHPEHHPVGLDVNQMTSDDGPEEMIRIVIADGSHNVGEHTSTAEDHPSSQNSRRSDGDHPTQNALSQIVVDHIAPGSSAGSEGKPECMICFDEIEDSFPMPCCRGSFHEECIIRWLVEQREDSTCPICRTSLPGLAAQQPSTSTGTRDLSTSIHDRGSQIFVRICAYFVSFLIAWCISTIVAMMLRIILHH